MIRTIALMVTLLGVAGAADFMGTWKLNVAKSTYGVVGAPKEQTVTYSPKGAGYDYELKGISPKGEPLHGTYTYMKDSVENKATGFPNWDGIVLTHGMSGKATAVYMRAGTRVGTGTRTLSPDGKTLRIDSQVKVPKGKVSITSAVYDRQ